MSRRDCFAVGESSSVMLKQACYEHPVECPRCAQCPRAQRLVTTTSSIRFKNSGRKELRSASMTCFLTLRWTLFSSTSNERIREPMLLVMIMMVP